MRTTEEIAADIQECENRISGYRYKIEFEEEIITKNNNESEAMYRYKETLENSILEINELCRILHEKCGEASVPYGGTSCFSAAYFPEAETRIEEYKRVCVEKLTELKENINRKIEECNSSVSASRYSINETNELLQEEEMRYNWLLSEQAISGMI